MFFYVTIADITQMVLLLLICDSGLARFAARWCQQWWVLEPADVSVMSSRHTHIAVHRIVSCVRHTCCRWSDVLASAFLCR